MKIVASGQARCSIRIDAGAQSSEVVLFAAQELREYVQRISGVALEQGEGAGGPAIELGLAGEAGGRGFSGADGYVVEESADCVRVRGVSERGVLYGVYALLESFGCRWYDYEEQDQVVPRKSELAFTGRMESSPDFHVRSLLVLPRDALAPRIVDWMGKVGYNWLELAGSLNAPLRYEGIRSEARRRGLIPILTGHTLERAFSLQELRESRPELFAELKGVRAPASLPGWTGGGQHRLCDTNPEAQELTAQKVLAVLRQYPEMEVVGITPIDGQEGWCDCAECRRIQPRAACTGRHGGQTRSDQHWHFVKGVMGHVWQELPHMQVIMWGCYNYYDPPLLEENLLPADKCWAMIDNFERCCTHDIDAPPELCWINPPRLECHRRWLEMFPERVYLYSELTGRFDFNLGRIGALPAHSQIQRDFAIYKELGVMGSSTNWEPSSMAAPSNMYFTGRVLWDVGLDAKGMREDFYQAYYGPVAEQMRAFFAALGELPLDYTRHTSWGSPEPLIYQLSEERIGRLTQLIEEATVSTPEEPYLARVVEVQERLETVVAWTRLYRASRDAKEIAERLEQEPDSEQLKQALAQLQEYARPYYLHLFAEKDPAARKMGHSGGDWRSLALPKLWETLVWMR